MRATIIAPRVTPVTPAMMIPVAAAIASCACAV
jgi:hypothetical protein